MIRRVLIHVTGDRIGDALLKYPVLRAFKRACAASHITWLAGQRSSVFKGPFAPLACGILDEVIERAAIGVSWRELIAPPPPGYFDAVLTTEAKLKPTLILRRVQHELFISPAMNFRFSDRRLDKHTYGVTAYERFCALMSLLAGAPLDPQACLPLIEGDETIARQALPDGKVYIGFAPGSASARKCWPLDRFLELAHRQLEHQRQPVFFLGPAEQAWSAQIRARVPAALLPEFTADGYRRGGPLLTIALARRLAVGVANDAGGGHLLAAGGRPLVSLFGHTSMRKFAPPYCSRVALSAQDFGGTDMRRIPTVAVSAAIDAALSGCHSAPPRVAGGHK